MSLLKKFSSNLKTRRIEMQMSQQTLGIKCGLSTSYISMLERGQRSPPLETLEVLSKVLKKPVSEMLS